MRSLMRAIAAVLRAMRTMVKVTAKVGGRLVTMFLPAPMPLIDQLEPETPARDPARDTGSVYMPIRNLAYARLTDRMPTPAELAAAGKLTTEWISVMPKPMLKSLLLADDDKLRRHMRGVETLKGVLRYDESVIDAYRIALLRQRAAEEAARRKLMPVRYA